VVLAVSGADSVVGLLSGGLSIWSLEVSAADQVFLCVVQVYLQRGSDLAPRLAA